MADFRRSVLRGLLLGSSLFALGACSSGFDLDLRDLAGGLDTSEAARNETERPPRPDDLGLISYPSFQVAVARRGDTLRDVARRIGTDPEALARHNGLDVDTALRQGEVVALPQPIGNAAAAASEQIDITALASDALDRADTEAATAVAPDALDGPEPIQHQVARGETAYSIARLYNVSVRALADWNGLGPDLNVREGQFLLIPIPKEVETTTLPAPAEPEVAVPGEGSVAPEPPSASTPLPEPEVDPELAATPAPPTNLGNDRTAASSGGRLSMPISGAIIRDYEKGKSDGIGIAASAGSDVRAAADGTVAAITRDTDGVPILVIRHTGNLLTVYANIQDVQFEKGASVSKGQTVAKVREGTPSFLHFEVREGFDSVDPITYLN